MKFVLIDVQGKGWTSRPCKIEHQADLVQVSVEDHPGNARNDYRTRYAGFNGNMVVDHSDLFSTEGEALLELARRKPT